MPKINPKVQKVRAAKILADLAEGKSYTEIAAERGCQRQTIARILASDEAEAITKQTESRITRMQEKAADRIEKAIEDDGDPTNALKAALAVLKSKGVIRDTVDITHSLPIPTLVRFNGEDKFLMGTTQDEPKDEDQE